MDCHCSELRCWGQRNSRSRQRAEFCLDGLTILAHTSAVNGTSPLNVELLRRLCEAPGAPGREERIRKVVLEALKPLCDEVSVDALGNVIGKKAGAARGGGEKPLRLMLS